MNDKQLKEFKISLLKETVNSFESEVMGSIQQAELYHNHLIQYFEDILEGFCADNKKLWYRYYEDTYHRLAEQYLKTTSTIKEVYVRLGIVREEFMKLTDTFYKEETWQILEGIWLKENIGEMAQRIIEMESKHSQERYDELY